MLTKGIFWVCVASVMMGWTGFSISGLSMFFFFVFFILNIIGSILIAKGTNLWIGIISFLLGWFLSDILFRRLLRPIHDWYWKKKRNRFMLK